LLNILKQISIVIYQGLLAARLAVAKQEHLELLKEQIVKYSQTD
jgi:hypothetical protein